MNVTDFKRHRQLRYGDRLSAESARLASSMDALVPTLEANLAKLQSGEVEAVADYLRALQLNLENVVLDLDYELARLRRNLWG